MTQTLVNRWIDTTGVRSATRWSQVAAVASALLLGASLPARAGDVGSFIGGVVGGAIGQAMQQPYYQQPQYQQPQYQQPQYQQPQYQQPQYQQPQYQQPQQSQASAEARRQAQARQAELKRQKAQQEKEKKEQEEARLQPAPAVGDASGPIDVAMKRKGGNLWVPAQINKVVTIDFVIDSGASDITLPRDVYLTLIRSGTLTKADYVGTAQYGIADGSEVKGVRFKLASLQVGNQILSDVVASVMPSDSATPLLGLSFLSRFQSWSIDNSAGTLKLTPIPSKTPSEATPTQVAAATQQALPDLRTIEPSAPQTPAATQTKAATAQPQSEPTGAPSPKIAAAASTAPQGATPETRVAAATPAPRSGQVANSAFVVKETAPAASSAATETKPETAAAIPAFPANTPYATARSSLLALGYGPAALPDAGKCDSNTDSTCFPERAACAKAESIQCDFLWRRGEQLIKVRTVAVPPTISSVECQVNCK